MRTTPPIRSALNSLDAATDWINSEPLTAAALRGNVVAVQFCTYSCINWIRTIPYVRAWAARYRDQGLVVIGAHTPEFAFEHEIGGVRRALAAMGVEYPVVLDNEYAIWRALRQPLLAGAVCRRRRRSRPVPPLRRGRLRGVRTGHPGAAGRRGRTGARPGARTSRLRPTGTRCGPPRPTSATPRASAGPATPRGWPSTSGRSPVSGRSATSRPWSRPPRPRSRIASRLVTSTSS